MIIIHWLGDASIEESSYGFKDVRTDSSGKLYMYLPASEAVKASFGGVEFTGKVEAGKDENVLEREQTSIDYQREVLKNTALYELEYAESENSATWTKIRAGGEASLTKFWTISRRMRERLPCMCERQPQVPQQVKQPQ